MSTRRDVQHCPDVLSLKIAAGDLIDAAGGSSKAAGYCRADQRRLSEYASPNTDTFMPVDVQVALEKRTRHLPGFPLLTREVARQLGFFLVQEPSEAPTESDLLKAFAVMAKEYGDAQSVTMEGLADGHLSESEAAAALKEHDEFLAQALAVRALLMKRAGGRA